MRKRLITALLILLFVVVLAAVGIYAFLPKLSQPLLEQKLAEIGCEQRQLRIEKIAFHGASIAEMHCLFPGKGEFALTGVVFAYTWRGLFSGQLDRLSVKQARVTISPASKAVASNADFQVPESFFYPVPIAELAVEKLDLTYPEKKLSIEAGLRLTFGSSSIEGRAQGIGRVAGVKTDFDATFSLQENELNLRAQKFSAAEGLWRFSLPAGTEINLKKSGDTLRASASRDLLVSLLYEKKWRELRLQEVTATIAPRLSTNFRLFFHEDLPALPITASFDQQKNQVELRGGSADFFLAKALPVLSEFLPKKDLPLQVTAGKLTLAWSGRMELGNASSLTAEAMGEFSGVDGVYGSMAFTGFSYPLRLRWAKNSFSVAPAAFRVESFDFGLVAKAIRANLGMQKSKRGSGLDVSVAQARAEIFSGEILVEKLLFDSATMESRFQAELKGLALREIVELQKQESISASGVLDGTLPIRVSKAGVVVEGGVVRARAPGGRIAYQAGEELAAVASGNPSLKLAVDVLRDFYYQTLDGRVDYAESGDLTLALRVEGRNPGWSEGRPVNFNFTIQDNLPKLLKSLRIAQEMGEALEKKMQEGNQ